MKRESLLAALFAANAIVYAIDHLRGGEVAQYGDRPLAVAKSSAAKVQVTDNVVASLGDGGACPRVSGARKFPQTTATYSRESFRASH